MSSKNAPFFSYKEGHPVPVTTVSRHTTVIPAYFAAQPAAAKLRLRSATRHLH